MIEQNYGSIVYISSIAGVEVIGAPIHYSVAKASLMAFAKNLSKKLARNNIRTNVICPGNIYFEEGTWDFKLRKNREEVLEMIDKTVPMNRFATPEEIANLALFLASERASFITGSTIIADGGQTVGI
jgi:3-oxoacyl-[acyl-carrier protein] reductase